LYGPNRSLAGAGATTVCKRMTNALKNASIKKTNRVKREFGV
jgi:hypothetical protein